VLADSQATKSPASGGYRMQISKRLSDYAQYTPPHYPPRHPLSIHP
jgi:hypothetical protein